jgi:hypothetical protein
MGCTVSSAHEHYLDITTVADAQGHGLHREKHMGTALLIGITTMLGCVALGLGVFVLGKPSPGGPSTSIAQKGNKWKDNQIINPLNYGILFSGANVDGTVATGNEVSGSGSAALRVAGSILGTLRIERNHFTGRDTSGLVSPPLAEPCPEGERYCQPSGDMGCIPFGPESLVVTDACVAMNPSWRVFHTTW